MTNRYRLSGTVDEAHLSSVIGAFSAAGLRVDYDPEITLSLLTKFNAFPAAQSQSVQQADAIHAMHPPAKRRQTKRAARHNGGEWPAKGSIYDIVLQSIQTEPKTPTALREILKSGGFSPGSVNSALGRLEKANRVKRGDGGWIAA